MKTKILFIAYIISCLFSACTFLFGDKNDKQVNEVFEQGKIDPNLNPTNLGYVPIFPFFEGIENPLDVYVGYDEFIYVIVGNSDANPLDNELVIYDQRGTIVKRISINGAADVTQDRRLHTYVTGRVETPFGNRACIYHLSNTVSGNTNYVDTLIHPLCDVSRASTGNRFANDEAVQFTGLGTLHDNTLYVSRTGPLNDVNSFVRPDNGVLIYSQEGENIGFAQGLNPTSSGLKSSFGISSISTLAGPPQRLQGISTSKNFMLTLANQSLNLEYRALVITVFEDPEVGTQYAESPSLLNFNNERADRFLYEPFRFKQPEDCYIAPDNLQYIFIVDSGTDSLYVFTNQGYEGVNPPPNSGLRRQVIVSFGGAGADGSSKGPFSFNDPSGVCYFGRTIFVADKRNNRICRYRLSNDLE
jgi:hypothetical protein